MNPSKEYCSNTAPRNEASALNTKKTEILELLSSIEKLKHDRKRILQSCTITCANRKNASNERIATLKHRLQQIRHSREYNTSTVKYDPIDGEDILRRLTRPEHFTANNMKFYDKTKAIADKGQGIWKTSEYQQILLASLNQKLLLKLIFVAIHHNSYGTYIC